jgi:hypothetical protein
MLIIFVGGSFIGASATVCTFFNLYVRHDYYMCAIVIPLYMLAAVGVREIGLLYNSAFWRIATISCIATIAAAGLYRSPYVKQSLQDLSQNSVVLLGKDIRRLVPPAEEIIVLGDDWNSRIPYYAERRAMTAPAWLTDQAIAEYANSRKVKFVVGRVGNRAAITGLWPSAKEIAIGEPEFVLFSIPR